MKTITKHYIDGAFVESHGRDVMDIIRPTDRKAIARVTLADEEDTRRASALAKNGPLRLATNGPLVDRDRAARS